MFGRVFGRFRIQIFHQRLCEKNRHFRRTKKSYVVAADYQRAYRQKFFVEVKHVVEAARVFHADYFCKQFGKRALRLAANFARQFAPLNQARTLPELQAHVVAVNVHYREIIFAVLLTELFNFSREIEIGQPVKFFQRENFFEAVVQIFVRLHGDFCFDCRLLRIESDFAVFPSAEIRCLAVNLTAERQTAVGHVHRRENSILIFLEL